MAIKESTNTKSSGVVPTDFERDEALLKRAQKIYEVETQSARHYDSLRAQTTNVTVVATGGLVAFGMANPSYVVPSVLLGVAVIGFAICSRLGHAYQYHWYLALKMRHLIIYMDILRLGKRRPKLMKSTNGELVCGNF